MTLAMLKPFLLVIVVGLLTITLAGSSGLESVPVRASLSLYFGRAVAACHEAHPKWQREICERVTRGEIWVGMDVEMIRASIGEPNDVDYPDSENPDRESWTYESAREGVRILEIEGGLLTGWRRPDPRCVTCGTKQPGS